MPIIDGVEYFDGAEVSILIQRAIAEERARVQRGDDEPLLEPDIRFPDRPHTLDLARLASAVSEQDAVADILTAEDALDADMASVLYIARNRIAAWFGGPKLVKTAHLAIYLDAFQLGVGFQKRGGHRPNETGNAGEGRDS